MPRTAKQFTFAALLIAALGIALYLVHAKEPKRLLEALPKQGLLGYEFNTELTVEGDFILEGPGDRYFRVTTVNGKKLTDPIDLPVSFPQLQIHATLKGVEFADDHKLVGVKDWRIAAKEVYEPTFSIRQILQADRIELKPRP